MPFFFCEQACLFCKRAPRFSSRFDTDKTFVTLAAHTGRSLFHSHSVDTTAITSFWRGRARMLGPAGKHDSSSNHANHVILQRKEVTEDGGFPRRSASDMYVPGEWAYLMMPTVTRLPMCDMAGKGFLLRNFSALGFSCDNWRNHTVTLTIQPVELRGPFNLSKPQQVRVRPTHVQAIETLSHGECPWSSYFALRLSFGNNCLYLSARMP